MRTFAADEVSEFLPAPLPTQTPTNWYTAPSRPIANYPFAVDSSNSLPPSVNFQAISDGNYPGRVPPDTMGAVGPNHVMTMLNTEVRIQSRSGVTNSTASLSNWWSGLGTFSRIFDPRLVYDPYGQRWIATVCLNGGVTYYGTSAVGLAVSTSSDPTSSWHFKKIDADPNDSIWVDFPTLGFNKNWIVIAHNMYTRTNTFDHPRIYLFNKTNIYAGGTNHVLVDHQPSVGGGFAPAATYDPDDGNLYLLQVVSATRVHVWSVTGSPGSPEFRDNKVDMDSSAWAPAINSLTDLVDSAPQTNSSIKIDTSDHRMHNVVFRNGCIWGVHNIFLPSSSPTRAAVQWWQFSVAGNGRKEQVGIIQDATGATHYGYPSIAVNKFDDVLIGFTQFSSNSFASGAYALRASTDQREKMRTPYTFKPGEGLYRKQVPSGNRWGDYSATVVDPVNDTDFWTIQEYAAMPDPPGTDNNNGHWGTWWAKVEPPVPVNDAFASALQISGSQGSTNGYFYRASKEASEPAHAGFSSYPRSLWYKWTAPASGDVSFTTSGTTNEIDTLLAVYTGSSLTNLTAVASNDNFAESKKSKLSFTAGAGTNYYIVVAGKTAVIDGADNIVLDWTQPTAPYFAQDPLGTNVVAGNSFVLTSLAIGVPTPIYQWKKNVTNTVSGATYASYTNGNVVLSDQGAYTVIASNSVGMATSVVANVWTYATGSATFSTLTYITNYLNVHISGVTTHAYVVQTTTDLTNWTAIHTNNASFDFSAMVDSNIFKFFRAVFY